MEGKEKEAAMKPFLTVSHVRVSRCEYANFIQELGQSGISLIRKNQLKAKFEKMQKEVSALLKAKQAADQKMVSYLMHGNALTS
jgi:alanyl-tRNA synthetase